MWASVFSVSNKSYWGSLLIGISLVLLLSYYQQKKLHLPAPEKLPLELLPVFFSATVLTFGLQDFLHLNAVLAAGCIGFLGSFLPQSSWRPTVYSGAFVGMTHLHFGWPFVMLASALAGLFYITSSHLFHGIGGKLGTVAFMGVVYMYLIFKYLPL